MDSTSKTSILKRKCTSKNYHTALHSALKSTGDIAQVRQILLKGGRPCMSLNKSCFEIAIQNKNWSKLKLLLDCAPTGVNIATSCTHSTALMKFGHIAVRAKYLLNLGADANATDINTESVLVHVLKHRDMTPKSVKLLIDAGADVNSQDKEGDSALMIAVQDMPERKLKMVMKMLINAGANVNFQDILEKSVLMYVVDNQNIEGMKILIEAGANVDLKDRYGYSVLIHALKQAPINVQVLKMLITAGADTNVMDKDGNSSLMIAIQQPEINVEIVKMFIGAGYNILAENGKGETFLTVAIIASFWRKDKEEIKLIIQYLLNLPEMKQNVALIAQSNNNPLEIILQNLRSLKIFDKTMLKIFELLVHSQYKDTNYLKTEEMIYKTSILLLDSLSFDLLLCTRKSMGAISFLINASIDTKLVPSIQAYVKVLLDVGFNMHTGISPLTVFLLNLKDRCNVTITDKEPKKMPISSGTTQFINFLIKNGAHVGQQDLHHPRYYQYCEQNLYFPDALFVALQHENFCAIRQLLPYWGFPGLYLLFFCRNKFNHTLSQLFPILTEHGGVPHGTVFYKNLVNFFEQDIFGFPSYLQSFMEIHSSPLSLRELCRYHVRASLAAHTSQSRQSMPELVKTLSPPPGLLDFLLMQPQGNPGVLVCYNSAYLALQGSQQQNDMEINEEEEDFTILNLDNITTCIFRKNNNLHCYTKTFHD